VARRFLRAAFAAGGDHAEVDVGGEEEAVEGHEEAVDELKARETRVLKFKGVYAQAQEWQQDQRDHGEASEHSPRRQERTVSADVLKGTSHSPDVNAACKHSLGKHVNHKSGYRCARYNPKTR
jgi:hypothetical protein